MTFWIITTAMASLVVLLLGRAMWRGAQQAIPAKAEYDLQVYREQLSEIERDVARGVVGAEDAERVRTEISRRILAANPPAATAARPAGRGHPKVVLAVIALSLVAGSAALYARLGQPGYGDLALADRIAFAEDMRERRPSQQSAQDSLPPSPAATGLSPEYLGLMQQLRSTVANRPDDLQGHQLLAHNEANIGNFAAAAAAQKDVLRIIGAGATAREIGDYAELLVLAAGGYVSPEAETALRAVLAKDKTDERARYYYGLMMIQTGRPDIAFRLWDDLLRRGPEDAPWIGPIRDQIMSVAALAGVDYSLPTIGTGRTRGPSAEDITAASDMTAEDRMEMIGGMVAGLSDRLASEGGPPGDWARLITSLGVLGDTDQALAVFNNAMQVFADDARALDMIRAAGSQAGVAE